MIGNENILMVIDPAYRPLKKFSPRGLRIMLSYLLLGIILSMIIAFLRETITLENIEKFKKKIKYR